MFKGVLLLSPREKVLLLCLLFMLLCTGFYRLVIEGQMNQYSEVQSKLQITQQEVSKLKMVLAREKQQLETAKEMDKKLNSLLPLFNTRLYTGDALAYLNWKAYESKVFIQDTKPMQAVDRKLYLEIPFTLKVQGYYNNIVDYVKVLENLPNISEIRRTEFRPLSKAADFPGSANGESSLLENGVITAELDLVIFSVKEEGQALEQGKLLMDQWKVGRHNAFQSVEPLSPLEAMTTPWMDFLPEEKERIGNP
ncbi:hypothetical protein Dred_1031 [Desulforamulus reducens MI-1]|uniref:Type IV pilus assembly protein PilO n=1 Tax=Desulforamulus reducens (strain ATCC BAA-1160 / DSM 100696 / MI-1) TaxID=349161 RepID=A4J3B3_DESRM|nr:type 4a pilus biogenesis protein PilO [Desulforamulus reducens]ABO49566.1 hypothetical protein Dred_1031 [Desulforamulus reducens MI-1]